MLVCTSVDSATTALQSGASTYRCISKQMHYKTPTSRMKSIELHENYCTSLSSVWKKETIFQYYINSEPCIAYSQSD